MTALDPCPDDLLARAANAPLANEERNRLAAHLARCGSCRAAADAAEALADEPSAFPGDERLIARLAERAAGRARASRPWRRRPLRVAAAAVVTASALAGLWHLGHRPRSVPTSPSSAPSEAPATPPPTASQPEVATLPGPTTNPAPADERSEANPKPAHRPASPTVDVDRLLGEARAARARGDNARARVLYARVARLAAGKPAGAVAEVAIGVLLLERADGSDARAALEAFDRYLAAAPAGALREEAMAGRARALERLGERARAVAAWQALLDDHPRSLQAPLARQRLEALAATPRKAAP